jgi:hypothetical protein
MRTTTERSTLFFAGALALAAWFVGLALLAYEVEPSREVIAWAPQTRQAAVTSGPIAVLNGLGSGFLHLRGQSPGFVRALYARGAWIVLPAGFGGCRSR